MPRLIRVALPVATAAVIAGGIGIANASVVGVPTKLTIETSFPAFHGKVKSDRDVCKRNRKVKMFQKQDGPDTLLGSDRSRHNGHWKVQLEPGSGAYYAKVKVKTKVDENGNGVICHKDRSRQIIID
jgi:hypothetical protein